ncbi:cell wall-binding repeat-containing protein [Clostridium sporogenes]
MNKKGTRALASATVVGLVLSTVATGNVKAAPGDVTRIGGADLYETASNVAKANWKDGAENVVLVSGEGYADSLSASVLATKLNAPIILTSSKNLDKNAKDALTSLKPKNVYVVGGNYVISKEVRNEVKGLGLNIAKELHGNTQFDTNLAIADYLVDDLKVDPSEVLVVNGKDGYADALSVAPVAASKGQVLLIVSKNPADAEGAAKFVKAHNSKVTVVGTKNIVPTAVLEKLGAKEENRVNGGLTQFDTNLNVMKHFGLKYDKVYVADASDTKKGYADALVASAIAGRTGSALILTDRGNSKYTQNAINHIKENKNDKTEVEALGGNAVMPEEVVNGIKDAVKADSAELAAAKKAVKAYEDAKITNLEEINAAKALGVEANKAVEAVKDQAQREALEAKIAAKDKLVAEAEAKLQVKVESVKVVNATTVEVTTEKQQTVVPTFEIKIGDKAVTPKTVELKKDDTSKKVFTIVLNDVDTLAKKQGELLVNGKSTKYDYKLPAVASVEAVANNRVMVTFDEEVSVLDKDNFDVSPVVGSDDITVQSAIVQADKTKVLVTLDKAMTAGKSNYVFNIKADAVKDIYTDVANKNEAYQVVFNGAGIADTQGATLLSAQYEKATKKVTVVFNKEMKASLDTTKVSINGVALTAQDAAVQDANKNTFAITLSDATKAKVDALAGDLTVKVAKDAVEDLNTASLKNVETTATLKVIIAPELIDADSNYDENTHVLTLKFSTPVKVKDIAKIKVAGENVLAEKTAVLTTGDEILDKDVASETVKIKLGATNQAFVQGLDKDAKLQVKLAIGAVEDANKIENSVAYDKQIKFVIDEVKPVLKTAAYSNADKSLILEFSEPVREANINAGNIAFVINGLEVDSKANTTKVKADGNRLILTLDSADATVLQDAYNDNHTIKVILKANAVQDYAGTDVATGNNANDAMKKENAVDVVFTNTKIPTVQKNLLSNTQIKLTFSGKMDKALVENIANYNLKDIYGNVVPIKSVTQDSGNQLVAYVTTEKPMTLTTGDGEGKKAYTLTINNLKSVEGIIMPEEKFNFEGSEDKADTLAPVINTAEYKTVAGYDNDTIKVEFTEASGLDKASAINPANYVLIDGTTETQLTADNAKIELGTLAGDKQSVTITLKGINLDATKVADKPYKIKVSNVKDVLGNVIATKDNANVKALGKAAGLDDSFNAVGISGLATANPNTADKIVLTFPEELDKATAEKVENYKVVIGGDKQPVTAVLDETGKKVTLTLADTDEIKGQNVTVKLQTGLKDAAQNALLAETPVIATVADLVKPEFAAQDAIKAEAKKAADGDVITLKFTEAVQQGLAEDETKYVVKVNGTPLVAKANDDADYKAILVGDTVTITLDDNKANFVKGDVITVTAKEIKDIAGNTMDEATVKTTATTEAKATDTIAEAAFKAGSGNRVVEVTFKDKLLASTVSKEDFVVEGNVVNDVAVNGDKVTLTLAAPVTGGQKITVKASDKFSIKDEVGNDLTVKSLGGENGVETTNAAEMAAAPALTGVSVADALGQENDNKTQLTLPALPEGATKYVAKVAANADSEATPKVGDTLVGYNDINVVNDKVIVAAANGNNIAVAAVDASGKVVAFTNVKAVTTAYEAAKAAVKTADADLETSVALDTATKIVLNGKDVTLTNVKALGTAYDAKSNKDNLKAELLKDINAVADLKDKFTVTVDVDKLVISSVEIGANAKVDLTGSDEATGATLLGFTTLDAVNGTDAAN